jgi:hypothetical protein
LRATLPLAGFGAAAAGVALAAFAGFGAAAATSSDFLAFFAFGEASWAPVYAH